MKHARWPLAISLLLGLLLAALPVAAQQQTRVFSLGTILRNPEAYLGHSLTFVGQVAGIVGPRAFVLTDASGGSVMVVTPSTIGNLSSGGLRIGQQVVVNGIVQEFSPRVFERQTGARLSARLRSQVGGVAVYALTVRPALQTGVGTGLEARSAVPRMGYDPGYGALPSSGVPAGLGTGVASRSAGIPARVSVDAILDRPASFVGRTVSVIGEIDRLMGNYAVTIEDEDAFFDDDLLVIFPRPLMSLPQIAGNEVVRGNPGLIPSVLIGRDALIQGNLRPFNLYAVERELGIDLEDDWFVGWDNRPVLLATGMTLAEDNRGFFR